MTQSIEHLKQWISTIASLIKNEEDPSTDDAVLFLQAPQLVLSLIELIDELQEETLDDDSSEYSACLYALDHCVAQLQSAAEGHNKLAERTLNQLMDHMAAVILRRNHSLGYWLPSLNTFYDVHVELSMALKNAYFELANDHEIEGEFTPEEESAHLNSIRDLIQELGEASVFDIAENFFAQSYAMPPDFFADLVVDLYNIHEGREIALLTLLHPDPEVREVVVETLNDLLPNLTLSPTSLTRLQAIKNWYPMAYHDQFNYWIKQQRKKGVTFLPLEPSAKIVQIKASEVDGSGAQGVFVHFRKQRKNRLCGLLFKQYIGLKDTWVTPVIPSAEVVRYYHEAFDDSIVLRDVDLPYFVMMTCHFLAITLEKGSMPCLHLLEMQEELGLHLLPQRLETTYLIEELGVQISPFTPESTRESLHRSKSWLNTKSFSESWFIENEHVDKLVNRCCAFVDGVKVCRFEEAMSAVLSEEMEKQREHWLFHFLWITLWLKAGGRKNETTWQDSFFIAYAIQSGVPLAAIPLMHEICRESVINSIETMQSRRTHLN